MCDHCWALSEMETTETPGGVPAGSHAACGGAAHLRVRVGVGVRVRVRVRVMVRVS